MPSKATAPAFTSDRLTLLGPLVTPDAIALARHRLIHDTDRITERDKSMARVALLLLRIMNPDAHLTNEEEATLRGMDRKTVGKRKAAGEI